MNVATLQEPSQVNTTIGIKLLPFRVRSGRLELLHSPGQPGSMLAAFPPDEYQELDQAVARFGSEILTGEGSPVQLRVSGSPARGLTGVYVYLVRPSVPGQPSGQPVAGFSWRDLRRIPFQADDDAVVGAALSALAGLVEHGDAGFQMVGEEFTVSELRQVHEAVLQVSLDPSNFRKRVCRLVKEGSLVELPTRRPTATRPARLYRMA